MPEGPEELSGTFLFQNLNRSISQYYINNNSTLKILKYNTVNNSLLYKPIKANTSET